MGGGHRHAAIHDLCVPGNSVVHRLAPQVKIVALVVFVSAVAVTPRRAVWVFVLAAVLLAIVAIVARVPAGVIARRALVVAPFLLVAALVPFIGDGPRTAVGPFSLSIDGLWAAWNIAAKALIGATASVLLMATTPISLLLVGMTRLRVPAPVVAIVSFMVRYLELIVDAFGRMRVAMAARGHDPRWLWQVRPIAASAGTLFVRTYERGERIHHAMAARGFDGQMPDLDPRPSRPGEWIAGLALPAVAVAATITAFALR